ncbi:MAG: NUDIX domain-containing protein [Verrucomicrobiota bacterium]
MPQKPLPLRPNAAMILERGDGRILLGERADRRGQWQFPQGGVDPGETTEQALRREAWEEIGLKPKHYQVVEAKDGYSYVFPEGHRKKGRWRGQSQTFYRCRFVGKNRHIRLHMAHEFQSVRWVQPSAFLLDWVPDFKREVFVRVFWDFFGVEL